MNEWPGVIEEQWPGVIEEAGPKKKKDTSFSGALGYGLQNAKTMAQQTYDLARGIPIRPDADPGDYSPASPVAGFKRGMLPGAAATLRYMAENLPPAVAGIGAAAMAPEGAAILAATAAGTGLTAGHFVKQRAENMGHETPTSGDIAAGLGTAGASSLVSALPVSRMLPGANAITGPAQGAIRAAGQKLATTVAAEGAAGAGSNLAAQAGSTAGTPGGLNIDPTQLADATIGQAAGAAALKGPRAIGDYATERTFKGVTPENAPAAAAFAERLKAAASEGKPDKAALEAATKDIHGEIAQGAKGIEGLSQDAKNALARPSNLGKDELRALKDSLSADQSSEAVMHLVRQAQMAEMVRTAGTGRGSQIEKVFPHPIKHAIYGAIGSHFVPGAGFIGPGLAAALAGGYTGARGIDFLTGARNPTNRFVNRFQQPGAQTRLEVPAAQTPPVDPLKLYAPEMKQAQALMQARVANVAPTPMQKAQMSDTNQQMQARRQNAKLEEANAPPPMEEALAPTVTKVSKANGKTQHTVEAPPPIAEAMGAKPFEPKTTAEMPYYGLDHADAMAAKLSEPRYATRSKEWKEDFRAGGIKGRARDASKLEPLIKETADPVEKAHILELIEELHHTSGKQRARDARDHYASQVNPALGARIKAVLSDAYINKSKPKD